MPNVTIEERGCRACTLCATVCPTDVLAMNEQNIAVAIAAADCIGCTSCVYVCPSRCIDITDVPKQRPFHRIEENSAIVAKFLQQSTMADVISEADLIDGTLDVSMRLIGLTDAVVQTMGRGLKAAGRKAGQLAASHFPELYEGKGIDDVLVRMQTRFAGCFDFEPAVRDDGKTILIKFSRCAIADVVAMQGATIGTAVLCELFHEYWAGLLGSFTQQRYNVRIEAADTGCSLELAGRQ